MKFNAIKRQPYQQSKWYRRWGGMTLKQKNLLFIMTIAQLTIISIVFNIYVVKATFDNFHDVLEENQRCQSFQEALNQERRLFNDYVNHPSDAVFNQLSKQIIKTKDCLEALNYNYDQIGKERYARMWSIYQSYEAYVKQRNYVLRIAPSAYYFVNEVYKTYDMQEYLASYAIHLTELTLQDGNEKYYENAYFFTKIPLFLIIYCIVVGILTFRIGKMLYESTVIPILELAKVSKNIGKNDYIPVEIVVENEDEIGQLVDAFNTMQKTVYSNMLELESKMVIAKKLYREKIEKMLMEQQLESIKLQLLQSQINPHFLFNTLNMIACMAQMEEADTTERMTKSLSNIFRYNLKETNTIVPIAHELKVVEDYLYIQHMRFSERVKYTHECSLNPLETRIPSHTLQPIVENAVIHGIGKKEAGGRIHLRVYETEEYIIISVADTGVGVSASKLAELENSLKEDDLEKIGIGLGNIYKRVRLMYRNGSVRLYSKEGCGFVVQMKLPKEGLQHE